MTQEKSLFFTKPYNELTSEEKDRFRYEYMETKYIECKYGHTQWRGKIGIKYCALDYKEILCSHEKYFRSSNLEKPDFFHVNCCSS